MSTEEQHSTLIDAKKKSLDLLSRREHSTRELSEKLRLRGYSASIIDQVIDYLDDRGYLSDARYAEGFVRFRAEKGYGLLDIQARLREKGVSSTLVSTAIGHFESEWECDWYTHAREVAQRKANQIGFQNDQKDRHRLARFLQSRGFTVDQSLSAIEQLVLEIS